MVEARGPWGEAAASVFPLASAAQERTENPVRDAEGCRCSYSNLLTYRTLFRDRSATDNEQQDWARDIASLHKKAARLGLMLVESQA
jgi:hypothetical protein